MKSNEDELNEIKADLENNKNLVRKVNIEGLFSQIPITTNINKTNEDSISKILENQYIIHKIYSWGSILCSNVALINSKFYDFINNAQFNIQYEQTKHISSIAESFFNKVKILIFLAFGVLLTNNFIFKNYTIVALVIFITYNLTLHYIHYINSK